MAGVTLRRSWRPAAVCALLAAAAIVHAASPPAPDFRPAPRSTLQTQREPAFAVARWQQGVQVTTLLARQRAGDSPLPVMRLVQEGQGTEGRVSIQHLDDAGAADLATLEQVYVLLMRQDPLARYCLGAAAPPCDAAGASMSHARALQVLAAQRERAAADVSTAVPWRIVEMHGAQRRPGDPDFVGVGALGPQGPLAQATLYFNRAPHSICAARTAADGQASCRLEDQHGDGDQHDHASAVVVTYPGEVRPDRVLLPTTYVLPGPPALPAFARPLAIPLPRPSAATSP